MYALEESERERGVRRRFVKAIRYFIVSFRLLRQLTNSNKRTNKQQGRKNKKKKRNLITLITSFNLGLKTILLKCVIIKFSATQFSV